MGGQWAEKIVEEARRPGYGGDGSAVPLARLSNGFAGRLVGFFRSLSRIREGVPARLTHVERIALGPRQMLHLIEADGVRLLVAISSQAAPVFFSLAPAAPCSADSQEHTGHKATEAGVNSRRTRAAKQGAPRSLAANGFGGRDLRSGQGLQ